MAAVGLADDRGGATVSGNCGDCWYRLQVAVGGYFSNATDRCFQWENIGSKLRAAGECDLWRPMTEEERAARAAFFALKLEEWEARQRAALEVLR